MWRFKFTSLSSKLINPTDTQPLLVPSGSESLNHQPSQIQDHRSITSLPVKQLTVLWITRITGLFVPKFSSRALAITRHDRFWIDSDWAHHVDPRPDGTQNWYALRWSFRSSSQCDLRVVHSDQVSLIDCTLSSWQMFFSSFLMMLMINFIKYIHI